MEAQSDSHRFIFDNLVFFHYSIRSLIWGACSEIKISYKGTEAQDGFRLKIFGLICVLCTLLHIFADGFKNFITIFITSLNLYIFYKIVTQFFFSQYSVFVRFSILIGWKKKSACTKSSTDLILQARRKYKSKYKI